jgi:hypothetical protein
VRATTKKYRKQQAEQEKEHPHMQVWLWGSGEKSFLDRQHDFDRLWNSQRRSF